MLPVIHSRTYHAVLLRLPAILIAGLVLRATVAAAQADGTGGSAESGGPALRVDAAQLEAQIRRTEASTQLEAETKTEILNLFRDALTQLDDEKKWERKEARYVGQNRGASDELSRLKTDLAKTPPTAQVMIRAGATLDDLEKELNRQENFLKEAQSELKKAREQIKRRASVIKESPEQISAAKQELGDIEESLEALNVDQGVPELVVARRAPLEVKRQILERKIAALEQELSFFEAHGELLTARRDVAARAVDRAKAIVAEYRAIVGDRRRSEAEAAQAHAAKVREDIRGRFPVLNGYVEENAALAQELSRIAGDIGAAESRLQRIEAELVELESDFLDVKRQADSASFSQHLGVLLRNKRASLPDLRDHRRERRLRAEIIAEAEYRADVNQTNRAELSNLQAEVDSRFARHAGEVDVPERPALRRQLETLLREQRELYFKLWEEYSRYLGVLVALDTRQGLLVQQTDDFAHFIDERILWTRSGRTLDLQEARNAAASTAWLLDPANWVGLFDAAFAAVRHYWLAAASGAILICCLLLPRRRLRGRLRELGDRAAHPWHASLSDTIVSFLYTLLLALPWPLLLFASGWLLSTGSDGREFSKHVGAAMQSTALVWFPLLLLFHVCRLNGLAGAHFGWPASTAGRLRAGLLWIMLLGLPLLAVASVMNHQPDALRRESLGRLAFMAGMIVLAAFLYRLFRPRRGAFAELLALDANGWSRWWYYVGYAASVMLPLALCVGAALGYYYTVLRLGSRLHETLLVLVAAIVLYALMLRWLLLTRRRLAIQQARQRRPAAAAPRGQGEETEPIAPTVETPRVDLPSISLQTRHLLGTLIGFLSVVSLWFIWVNELPALGMLRQVHLWSGVTLAELVFALAVVVMMTVAAKNLPGLLEIAVLEHLPLDAGTRYASTAIARYLIIVVGVVVVFGLIGVGWSHVQWLVAAITVGLGFGLQEIFANFVSGLILLFERPIRVGDTVTVGKETGKVSRIRIRATTILDWNRKELVIPNKRFVTGDIVNWTLSSEMLRLTFNVGVSYNSDARQVREILLATVRANKRVLDKPKPKAFLMEFGPSSLIFEVRAFVDGIDDWILARHNLHVEIHEALRKAGIEIAFPQHDVHIRSIEPAVPGATLARGVSRG